ncbi:MAG: PilN domain-containing protein [Parashewanella sp.]
MKNRINLYSESLLPQKLRLSFTRLLTLCVLLGLVLAASAAYLNHQLEQLNQSVAVAEQLKIANQSQVDLFEQELGALMPSPKLVEQVELRQKQLKVKDQLISKLSDRNDIRSKSYLGLLTDLAKSTNGDIWLTQFSENEDKLLLKGRTRNPAAVPHWIDNLRHTQSFSGRSFGAIRLSRVKDNTALLEFALSTDALQLEEPEVEKPTTTYKPPIQIPGVLLPMPQLPNDETKGQQ